MKAKILKVSLALVLIFCLAFSFSAVSFAADNSAKEEVFSFSVRPERPEYQKGEEIKFISEIRNKTTYTIENVAVIADVPETDTYLTRGVSEITYKAIEAGQSIPGEYKFSEYEAVVKIGTVLAAVSGFIASLYLFIIRKYNAIASLVVTVSLVFTTAFASAPSSLVHLTAMRESQNLGKCKVVYDGTEYEFGFHATYEKKVIEPAYTCKKIGSSENKFEVLAEAKENGSGICGIVFGAEIEKSDFEGYIFFINSWAKTAGVLKKEGNDFTLLSKKNVTLNKNEAYKMKIISDGTTAKCFLYNNPLEAEPYPLFDIPVSFIGNNIGTYTTCTSSVENVKINACDFESTSSAYTNPVMQDGADPYVLFYDGTYYMYATNGFSQKGFEAYTSKDLVNWEYAGVVAEKPDILGEYNFWAPEVYCYNNQFYMLYSAEEYTAVAVADSPLGPFKKTSDSFIFDFHAIDGNLLFDDDGRIYMYFSRILHSEGEGQQIWGVEMNSDLLSAKLDTLTLLTAPNKEWEGWVNEGPFMLKHNGTYYLSYSGEFYFNINYSVGYATSDSPLGTFTRYENNPILAPDTFIHGTGHHAFVNSPDGSELFIVYHCHKNTNEVHDRKICIDRVKFVPTESGIDAMTVLGPTVTPQPLPSK